MFFDVPSTEETRMEEMMYIEAPFQILVNFQKTMRYVSRIEFRFKHTRSRSRMIKLPTFL